MVSYKNQHQFWISVPDEVVAEGHVPADVERWVAERYDPTVAEAPAEQPDYDYDGNSDIQQRVGAMLAVLIGMHDSIESYLPLDAELTDPEFVAAMATLKNVDTINHNRMNELFREMYHELSGRYYEA